MTATPTVSVAAPVPVLELEQGAHLLQTLTGHDVQVRPARPVLPGQDLAVISVYVSDDVVTGAVSAWDLSLATCAGAALGQVPLAEVEEALATGTLSGDLADNFAEVANVLASAFNESPGAPHLQLHQVHAVGEELPDDVALMLRYVVRRVDLEVDIAGYGGGRLSVVAIG
jgi:hypothetical protein